MGFAALNPSYLLACYLLAESTVARMDPGEAPAYV
jgi:hypothetical protein